MLTKEQIEALRGGTTPGPWRADGEPWNRVVWSSADNRVCFMAHSNGLNDERDIATSNLAAAAPDLACTALDALARLADAQAAQALVVERAGLAVANVEIGFHDGISGDWHPMDGPSIISACKAEGRAEGFNAAFDACDPTSYAAHHASARRRCQKAIREAQARAEAATIRKGA